MNILEQALSKIKSNKKQRNFIITLITGFIGIIGKRTFRNLARYMEMSEHTFSRQMTKFFDFADLNTELIKSNIETREEIIASQDSTFVSKSGKMTHGLGFFWNGCEGKAEKGLELDVIGIVKIGKDKNEGFSISAKQTPSIKKDNVGTMALSRMDAYLNHFKEVVCKLLSLNIKHIAVDAFYKFKYVDGVVALGINVIGKMRHDARLYRAYNGPQKARGRRKRIDSGKIDFNNLDIAAIETIDEKTKLHSCVAYSKSLKREIKAVLVRQEISPNKYSEMLLYSTDITIEPAKIYKYYSARFQIEFLFRDSKNFTGLTDCQSRNEKRLHYHFNASLLALNIAKLQDHKMQQGEKKQHSFSMASWSRKYNVNIVLNRFISMLGLDPTFIKLHPNYENMLSFGSIKY